MAFLKINVIKSINNYSGGLPVLVAEFEVDDVASLPAQNQTTYLIGIGSIANVISTASRYKIQSDGTWVLQNANGTAGYTKEEIDEIIDQTISDTEDYADNAVSTAVGALDATSVGGSGRYISSIYETDGIIHATPSTIQTSVNTSTNAVSSNAVKTYVDNQVATKASITDIYGPGIIIPDGADLNSDTYKQPGVYYRKSTSTTEYVSNTPVTSNYFKIIVEWVYPDYRLRQTFVSLARDCTYYMRVYDSGGWQAWNRFRSNEQTVSDILGSGTRIPASSNLNDYWTAGSFHILTTNDASDITNKPNDPDFNVASVRAKVLVIQFSGSTATDARCCQVYIPARTNSSTGTGCFYIRYRYISSGAGYWTSWSRIDGTVLT